MPEVKLLTDTGVGQILESARDTFSQIAERSQISSVIAWQKEAGFARQILLRDERLLQCSPDSIRNAVTNVAATGLTLNPIKQHAIILARWNPKTKGYDASLMVMYRGLMWLAGQAGVTDITAEVVYSSDKFSLARTSEGDKYEHVIAHTIPRDGISNKFIGCYVAARMPGSQRNKVEWVPCEDIFEIREMSESYRDKSTGKPKENSPWVKYFDEMAKKVAVKRAQKRWEEAVIDNDDWKRFQTAIALDNANEGVIPARASDIPGTAEHIKTEKEQQEAPLTLAQLTAIEKLVEQVAPNSDKFPNNVSGYMTRMARTYRADKLSDVPAYKFTEIKKRVEDAIKKIKVKAAPDADSQEAAKGQRNAGKQQDAAAQGAGQQVGGKAAGDAKAQGRQEAGGTSRTSSGSDTSGRDSGPSGGRTDREPGSDDER